MVEPLAGRKVEVGDLLKGNLLSLGREKLQNDSQDCTMSVLMKGHLCERRDPERRRRVV